MYLRQLYIQGFKSFATRAQFEFGQGVTAIVGPNGVGKSNVADAIRWVLGEQSGRLLRTRKTEDVIFFGSASKTPLGMAEVSITFDNEEGWLPIEFSEVTITRRAYRSGESEYFLNRVRVRLKDVVELLAQGNVGQSGYTILGQGMVDEVLSLRPEERRTLLEEAAGVKGYRQQLADAREKLTNTRQNLERLSLIVAELAPQVKRLQARASSAEEHGRLSRELTLLLSAWYGHLGQRGFEALERARAVFTEREREYRRQQSSLQNVAQQLEALRTTWHRDSEGWKEAQRTEAALREKAQELTHTLAMVTERLASGQRRETELLVEVEDLQRGIAALRQQIDEVRERQETLKQKHTIATATYQALRHKARELSLLYQRERDHWAAAQQAFLGLTASLAQTGGWITQVDKRMAALEGQRQEALLELKEADDRLGTAEEAVAGLDRGAQAEDPGEQEWKEELEGALAEAIKAVEALERALWQAGWEQQWLLDLSAALGQERESPRGSSLGLVAKLKSMPFSRFFSVQKRVADPPLPSSGSGPRFESVMGTIASLIQVPKGLETAIEAALGAHANTILVAQQRDAEAAIASMKQNRSGRMTFLALDRLRGSRPLNLLRESGVVGVAARLVSCAPAHQGVIDTLLGHVIVVENLSVAKQIVARSLGTVVTLDGEVLHPTGFITGGFSGDEAKSSAGGVGREAVDLPKRLQGVGARIQTLEQDLTAQRERANDIQEQLAALTQRAETRAMAARSAQQELEQQRQALEALRQEQAWCRRRVEQLETEQKQCGVSKAELQTRECSLAQQHDEGEQALEALSTQGALLEKERTAADATALEAKANLDALEAELRHMADLAATLTRHKGELEQQVAAKEARRGALAEERMVLLRQRDAAEAQREEAAQELRQLADGIAEERSRRQTFAQEEAALQQEEASLRMRVMEIERDLEEARGWVRQRQQEVASLRERVAEEVATGMGEGGLPALSSAQATVLQRLGVMVQDLAPGGEGESLTSALGPEPTDAEAVKRRIDRLRAQLRHLGPLDRDAMEEFQEVKSRHDFLTAQMQDLRGSDHRLQKAIGELESLIQRRLQETFQVVQREFQRYFTAFFGGGKAHLSLLEGDVAEQTGLEVVVQPPGKRRQSLALLSGGERALTATALVFALLKARPTPFCVLDEVDAALDDTNTGRFSEALRELCQRTQFILITHNRGTLEVADTLYGISMGEDHSSQVLSLRLNEAVGGRSGG